MGYSRHRTSVISKVLTALYGRGAPRPVEVRRASWPEVLRCLRRAQVPLEGAGDALRRAGFWAEALAFEAPGLMSWADALVEEERVLTAADASYPLRWARVLGAAAPPVLYRSGPMSGAPCVSVVGSRAIPRGVARFCAQVGEEAARLGFALVSGAAAGCDSAAAAGAIRAGGEVIELLPHGDLGRGGPGVCRLSVCAPGEEFSSATAMERNALIYAFSAFTVVGAARFKEGGTWHGAVHASRRRLSSLLVRECEDIAMRALASLGGAWLSSPAELGAAMRSQPGQAALFDMAL